MASHRPHILILMSDSHRFDVAGFAGNAVARTPTLDRLAADAVVFDNAYTPSPICMPGRQCIYSGQLPHTCGCFEFFDDLPAGHMTYARRFAQFGYRGRLMIRQDHLKYLRYECCGPEALFDLHRDPRESTNVIADEAYAAPVQRFRSRADSLAAAGAPRSE